MPDNFPRGSVIRRVNIEPAISFGAGRALVLQLAHPAVAQGVADHSDFKANPFKRLRGTLEATYAVVFGSRQLAGEVGRRIRWVHGFVVGDGYRANDPDKLLWVHATLCDTALRGYETLVEPLSPTDRETYYQEMKRVGTAFGVPDDVHPPTLADFGEYFDKTVAALEMTPVGRDLSAFVLDPKLPLGLQVPLRPLLRLQRFFSLGTLPGPVRDQLGAPWGPADRDRYDRAERRLRRLFQLTPRTVRTTPNHLGGHLLLWQAGRRVRRWRAELGNDQAH